MNWQEVQFDGLVGPSHNFGGLAYGNIASLSHKDAESNPQEAALQGLKKMLFVMRLGVKQAVLPPAKRPDVDMLRRLGYNGETENILKEVLLRDPILLSRISSASNMWVANASTVAPSLDTRDRRLHFSIANLLSNFHRSFESDFSLKSFRMIFSDPDLFQIHPALPGSLDYSDEGAANHIRLCPNFSEKGLEVFVFGKEKGATPFKKFPARQTKIASEAIANRHGLDADFVLYLKQKQTSIDKGIFHNDVISVGNQNVLFYHEDAFEDKDAVSKLAEKYYALFAKELIVLPVLKSEISLKAAIGTYLFNSQIITLKDGSMVMIAPLECQKNRVTNKFLNKVIQKEDCPINKIEFFDLKESMWNGGGPACLRLRVLMSDLEISQMQQGVIFTEGLYDQLCEWVKKHYRKRLTLQDLGKIEFYYEVEEALFALEEILNLKGLYRPS